MKASREVKRWIAKGRKRHGKSNGVIPVFFFDNPKMDIKMAKSEKQRKNQRKMKIEL